MKSNGKVALKRRSSSVRERDDDDDVNINKFPKLDSKTRKKQKNTKPIGDFAKKIRNSVKNISPLKKSFCETKKDGSRKTKVDVLKSQKGYAKNKNKETCREKNNTTTNNKEPTQKAANKFGTVFQIKTKSKSGGDCVTQSFSPKSNVNPTPSTTVNCIIFPKYTLTTRSALRIGGGMSEKLFDGLPNKSRSVNRKCSEKTENSELLKSEPSVVSPDYHKAIVKTNVTSHWHIARGRREASLNASAKMRLLYENNVRGNWTREHSNCNRDERDLLCEKKREKTRWNYKNIPEKQNLSNKVMKAKHIKKQKEKLQRHPRGIVSEEVFDTRSCKRMANLNAQAILCASYSQERWRREKIENNVYPTVDVQYEISHIQEERLEAFSVHSSITDSTKEHEMHMTTCNTHVMVTPHNNDEAVKFEKVTASVSNKKNPKPARIQNLPNNQLIVGRRNNHIEPLPSGPAALIPVSSTSEGNRTRLEKVGMAQYTEVTKVHINARKEMGVKEEKTKERILDTDNVAITRMCHYQTNATSQSYRLRMETTYKPNLTTHEFSPLVRQKQKSERHVSSVAHVARPVMHGTQNLYNYSAHSPIIPVSSPQSFRNGLNNMAMVGMGPTSSYESAFSVPHFGHSPSMPYTSSEYNGYYQPVGSIIQPILDPYLVHKPVPCHPTQHQHLPSQPTPPSQPHNHYSIGNQCLSRHGSATSCSMEPISQLHYPHKFINNPSHCFNRDAPHDSPPLSYYTHDMPRKTKLLPLSQENAPQNNDSRGFSQDPLPHNAQPLLQNDITDSPRPHYPQNLLASKTIPSHGFLQDPHLYRCSRDISNYNQTPRPYPVPSDVLDPNNPTSGLYSQENSLVLPRRHLKQSPSCHSLPQIPPGTHSNFHGSVHGPSFHYQSHTSPVQQRHNPKLESTGHEGNNNSCNYSPGPTYHELTPVIISRQKDIRTQIPKPTSPEGSFLSVPKAEPVNPSDTSPHRHSHQLSSNKHNVSCGKTTFPRSDTDKAIAVQSDCEAPPCSNPSTVLNGRMSSSLEKERPPISLPGKNTPSCSTANGNQNISCTPNHKNLNVVNQTLASEKTKELKSKRRTKKRVTSNQNSNSSNNKALKNSLKEGNGSFHVLKSSSIKIKHNQSKKFDYVIKEEHQDEKQRKTKVKLSNKSAKNLKLNGSLPLSKQELSRKNGKKKHSNGWSWDGTPFQKLIFLSNDNPPRFMKCFLSMRHLEGDVIRVKDCVLLKSGPKKTDLPFVAKVVDLWEDPEDGEMMMSLMWYYRPEHTEQGRRPQDMEDEIFASKHRDVNSVACIEDKCYVLTFTEYCRYRKGVKLAEEKHHPEISMVPKPEGKYPRVSRLPPEWVSSEMVFFCRKVYDFRQKRLLKNPM